VHICKLLHAGNLTLADVETLDWVLAVCTCIVVISDGIEVLYSHRLATGYAGMTADVEATRKNAPSTNHVV